MLDSKVEVVSSVASSFDRDLGQSVSTGVFANDRSMSIPVRGTRCVVLVNGRRYCRNGGREGKKEEVTWPGSRTRGSANDSRPFRLSA